MYRYVDEGERAKESPRQGSGKGLAYWTDGRGDERILFITVGYQLVALDAKTGVPVPGFGTNGRVDLKQGLDQPVDPVSGEIAQRSALVVARNVAIIGAAHDSQSPKTPANVKGYMRGYDVRTGKRLWIFHTIPAARRVGTRHLGEGLVVLHRQHRLVGADDGRRRARAGLSADRGAHQRLLRRPSARQRALRREPGGARSDDRASASGTTSSSTTASGTTTRRPRRSWPM